MLCLFAKPVLRVQATQQIDTAQARIEKAKQEMAIGNYETAINELKSAEFLDKRLPEAKLMLAILHRKVFRRTEAMQYVDAAIKLQTVYPDAHYIKALLLAEDGRLKESYEEVKTVLSQGGQSARVCSLMGDLELALYKPKTILPTFPSDQEKDALAKEKQPFFEGTIIPLYQKGLELKDGDDDIIAELFDKIEALRFENELTESKSSEQWTRLQILTTPRPNYTREASDKDVQGVVMLQALFRSNGQISSIIVIQGLPFGLNEQALKSASGITFQPVTRSGKPISTFQKLKVSFSLIGGIHKK